MDHEFFNKQATEG